MCTQKTTVFRRNIKVASFAKDGLSDPKSVTSMTLPLLALHLLSQQVLSETLKEAEMKNRQSKRKQYSLGDLIVLLFEESRKVSSDRDEQKLLVYAALKDLLRRKVHSNHPIALTA
jgi:hypothetical protein